ncbi:MAG: type II toxin-antitoxin system CcdA family antitoxin [Pseudomonadota bacterium]|nr:type II toxin-antitoxin system CcdA family antitoxin [Pseudomonadota bacterium]
MNAFYNLDAPKKALNLSLNTDLVVQARQFTDNLSNEVETMLVNFVAEKKGLRREHMQSLQRAAQNWNNFVEKHGSFADEYSTL